MPNADIDCPHCGICAVTVTKHRFFLKSSWEEVTCSKCQTHFMYDSGFLYNIPDCQICGRRMQFGGHDKIGRVRWHCEEDNKLSFSTMLRVYRPPTFDPMGEDDYIPQIARTVPIFNKLRICVKHDFVLTYDAANRRYFCPQCEKIDGSGDRGSATDTLRQRTQFCRYCGVRTPGDSRFCEACGSNLAVNSTTGNETDKSANKCPHGYSLEEHCPTCVEHRRKMKLDTFNATYAAALSDRCPACSVAAGFVLQDVIDKGLLSRKVWRKTTCRNCDNSFMLLGDTLYSIPICEKCGKEMRLVDGKNPQRITWKCFKHHSIGYGGYMG